MSFGSSPIRVKSLPLPLKSLDCFVWVVIAYCAPHPPDAVTMTFTLTDSPGESAFEVLGPGFRSWIVRVPFWFCTTFASTPACWQAA